MVFLTYIYIYIAVHDLADCFILENMIRLNRVYNLRFNTFLDLEALAILSGLNKNSSNINKMSFIATGSFFYFFTRIDSP